MKKLYCFFVAMCFMLFATVSFAGEFRAGLELQFVGNASNYSYEQQFNVYERGLASFSYVADENLSGFIQLQYGDSDKVFGDGTYPISLRMAYIDWILPLPIYTSVKVGKMPVINPSFVYSGVVIDTQLEGVSVAVKPFDFLGFDFAWYREMANKGHDSKGEVLYADVKFDVPQIGLDGYFFGVYTDVNSSELTYGYLNSLYVGAGFKYTLGPVSLGIDGVKYGSKHYGKGLYFDALLQYQDKYGTPYVSAWYATGNDEDGSADSYSSAFSSKYSWFMGTSGYFAKSNTYRPMNKEFVSSATGTFGISVGVKNVSFLSGLTHNFNISWVQGTNEYVGTDTYKLGYMSKEDEFVEFDLDTVYKVSENLSIGAEGSYMIANWKNGEVKNGYGFNVFMKYVF